MQRAPSAVDNRYPAKTLEGSMSISASGVGTDVHFDGNTISISSRGMLGKYANSGDQQFHVGSISAVNHKAATKLSRGYVQFLVAGFSAMPAPSPTNSAAWKEFTRQPNVITFQGRANAEFEALRAAVQQAIQRAALQGESQPATGSASVADEVQKLASLRDSGVLTQEEFEAEKRRLLQ